MVTGASIAAGIVVVVVVTTSVAFVVRKKQANARKIPKSEKGNFMKE